jgi:hypothetical protein
LSDDGYKVFLPRVNTPQVKKRKTILMNTSYLSSVSNTVLLSKPSTTIRLLLMVLFVFIMPLVSYGQTASSTWVLTSNQNSANVGNVTGAALAIGSGLNNVAYGTTGVTTDSWSKDAAALVANEYYEFKVTPNANTIFNVTTINFEHSTSNGNWNVQAFYSTDNFATSTPITTVFGSSSTNPTASNNPVNINVDGATLSVRIYGWEADKNNRSLRIKNVVISGTTCAKPVVPGTSSAYSASCSGFTAQWGYSNYSTAYFIDVATSSTFAPATIVPAYNNRNVGNVLSLGITGLNPGITYYYRVRASNSCSTSANSGTMNYTTSPSPTVAPVAKAASNIQCTYVQLNFTTGSNVTGVYLDIARDNGFTDFLSGYNNYDVTYNNGSIPVSNLPAGTLYYRIRGYNSCAVTANSNTISFSTPSPIGGSVSSSQKICSGTSPANLVLTGYSTTNTEILKWQKSSDAVFSSPVDIAVTTPTLSGGTIGNLTVETYFRAVVRNKFGSWCESFSNPVFISITQAPIVTPNKVNETCSSSNDGAISPSLSGGLTNIRYLKLTQKYVNAEAYQQVAEIEAIEIFTGTNVALSSVGALATASSIYSSSYPASEVNDGIPATDNNMWHSISTNINEYVQIDLQSARNLNYIRIHNRTDCCWSRGQNMLLELFDASNNLVYSKTVNLWGGVNSPNFIDVNVLDVSWADSANTLNRTNLDSGTYTLNYADALGCNVVYYPITISAANASPSMPTIGTPKQPDCKTVTGSVVLSGLPAGNWTINPGGIAGNTSSVLVSNLTAGTYNFTVSIGNCTSAATADVIINAAETNTWTTKWSHGTPNSSQKLVFTKNYPPVEDPKADITGCSCMVTGGAEVTIKSGKTLTIINELEIKSGKLTFEDTASLIQINNLIVNTEKIIYKRKTSSVLNSDYTYWSSPVAEQKLSISQSYQSGMFYSYDDFATPENWKQETSASVMQLGKGYIIRGSQTSSLPAFYDATFEGVPNNGTKTISIGKIGTSNLLGNPYPSAIDANAFLAANSKIVEGTIYFWTHNTAIQLASGITGVDEFGNPKVGSGAQAYTSDDYATYNTTGGVGTGNFVNGVQQTLNKPTGKIAAGQAFFTTSKATGAQVTFNNIMRVAGNNTQFFKTKNPNTKTTSTIEKHRVWLDLSNNQGAFKQTLIGYVSDATNEYDSRFDGESFDGNEFVDFYSINQDKNLVIQGRALPFDENDEVALGFRSTIDGSFTINIDQVDGLLANQPVFIEDKLTNTVFDLKSGNYKFNTVAGTFDNRFVLHYTNKTLGTENFDSLTNKVLVSNANKQIKINSFAETIDKVVIYDLLGRQIYQKGNVDSNELSISNLVSSRQVLIVKTRLQNGQEVSNKIVY